MIALLKDIPNTIREKEMLSHQSIEMVRQHF